MDVSSSDDVHADLNVAVSTGRLGLTLRFFGDGLGGLITVIDPRSPLRGEISVGDRLMTIDGRRVTKADDLSEGNDKQRVFGFSLNKDTRTAAKTPAKTPATASATNTLLGEKPRASKATSAASTPETTPPASGKHENKREANWESNFSELIAYKQEHGDCAVPTNCKLGHWASNLRKKYKEEKLSEARIKRLNEVDFEWEVQARNKQDKTKWIARLSQLKEYRQEHGNCGVPQSLRTLNNWCSSQRAQYRKGNLTENQINQLEALDFKWMVRGREWLDKLWEENFAELQAFRAEHGHCMVNTMKSKLGNWVDVQRTKQKQGKLAAERIERLDGLGFVWGKPRESPQEYLGWEARYSQLLSYHKEHGDCAVPSRKEKDYPLRKLASWVNGQRTAKRRGKLSEERIRQLEEIGFTWGTKVIKDPGIRFSFEERVSQLKEYRQENGDIDVKGTTGLGRWVKSQRQYRRNGLLSEDRIRKLDELGFDWQGQKGAPVDRADVVELTLAISPGRLGLTVQFDDHAGGMISTIHPLSPLEGKINVGDRLVTIDGRRVTKVDDLSSGSHRQRFFGFARRKDATAEDPVPEDDQKDQLLDPEEYDVDWATAQLIQEGPEQTTLTPENEARWEEMFARLRQFGEENGHFKTPRSSHSKLRSWVDKHRYYYKNKTLPNVRIARLEAIGFEFLADPSRALISLEDRIAQLKEYSQHYGNCDVPLSNPVLGKWVWHQRNEYKKMKLSDKRIKCLEDAGFEWQLSFEERLLQLQQYAETHGDCNPPQNHAVLGAWVKSVRLAHQKGELSGEFTASLAAMGFRWGLQPRANPNQFMLAPEKQARWEEMYATLQQFGEENGHFEVPLSSHPETREWVDEQRSDFKQNKLPDALIARLEAIGFDLAVQTESPREVTFMDRIAQLKQYSEHFGNCDVALSHPVLGEWVWQQRNEYKKMNLSDDRIKCLEAVAGFEWQLTFEERLFQLQQYAAMHGNCNPPQNHVVLAGWVKSQRQAHKMKTLSNESVASLTTMGFCWSNAPPTLGWDHRYELLRKYKLEVGDCNPPRSHPSLGHWVGNQRRLRKNGKLSQERIAALDQLGGFNWGTAKVDPDVSWREQYNELVAYKAKHGNCDVPQAHTGLGRFVHWQRYIYKKGKISDERVDLLKEIGFNFNGSPVASGPTVSWDTRFVQLKGFKEQHGHCIVPRNEPSLAGLERWTKNQRCNFEKLSESQRNRLVEIGVTPLGNLRKEHWEEHFDLLVSYAEEHGDCNKTEVMSVDLLKWTQNQRKYYNRGDLPNERIERLKSIGFGFDAHVSAAPWEMHYDQLRSHKEEHGDCNDTTKMEKSLASWADNQRKYHKRQTLSFERTELLKNIGFDFNKRVVPMWEERYDQLLSHTKEHGDCNDTAQMEESLRKWADNQRLYYRRDALSLERFKRLKDIGFECDYRAATRNQTEGKDDEAMNQTEGQ